VVHFAVLTCLPPLPPPSLPNASRRWLISAFRCDSHHHVLPRIQTRAGGGPFRRFQGICRRRHIITSGKSITAKMDKRGRDRRKQCRHYYGRRGGIYTPRHPIRFFSLSVADNMYLSCLSCNTIKIVSTTPRSTTGFFQRLQRDSGKCYFSKDTQGYHQRELGNLIICKDI
jgi:hypothetical protein